METQLAVDRSGRADEASGPRAWTRSYWPEVVVAVLLLLGIGPLVQEMTAQAAPRVAMTGAMVDDGSFRIDGYLLGVDRAVHDGHTYSDKAPGQQFLAVPFYAAGRLVGAQAAIVPRVHENLTHWWMALTSGMVPLVVLVALMGRAARRRGLTPTTSMLAAMAFGTLLLPLASNLYGHVLTGALLYGAWYALDGTDRARGRAWVAGALMGIAVTCEYQAAVVVAVLLLALALRRRWGQLVRAVAAGIPWALLLMLYQQATTGSPLRTGYESKNVGGQSTVSKLSPSLEQVIEVLAGSRGIFLFTPVVALGVYGLVRRWRWHGDGGALTSLGAFGAMLLLQASWANAWGGDAPGPRYLAPAIPFVFVGLADVWPDVWRPGRRLIVAVSILSMGLATVTDHLVAVGDTIVAAHLTSLLDEGPVPTVFTVAVGPVGWLLHLAVVGGALFGLARWAGMTARPAPVEGASEPALR